MSATDKYGLSGAAAKRAAIEQWTADPCDEVLATGSPGSREYFESLLAAREAYAPWMGEVLDYSGSAGLDVLDVGCGQGIDVARFSTAGARSTGVDLTPRHAGLARAHLASLGLAGSIVEGDAENLPFTDASFDRVTSNGVLHHTPDFPKALQEAFRVLRPDGQLCVIVYNRASLHYWLNQVLYHGLLQGALFREGSMEGVLSRNVEFSRVGARPLVRVYSPRQLRQLIRHAGFAEVRTEVRHFHVEDAFVMAWAAALWPRLRDQRVLRRIGRIAGWYVIGYGRKP
jgi:ubiquinone/menaquinone biosynthesis C-methylase UbiE